MCKRYLSFDAENELIAKALAGCIESRNAVIMNSSGVIWKIARRFTGRNKVWNEECYQECVKTLCDKFHKFDLSRGVRWITWATWWIRQACFRYIQLQAHNGIKLPQTMHSRNPKGVGIPFANQARRMASLSQEVADQNSGSVTVQCDFIADHREPQPFAMLSRREDARWLHSVLYKLKPVHRYVLLRRANGKTLQQIGRYLSLTREGVRQVEERAKKHFVKLAEEYHPRELALKASC